MKPVLKLHNIAKTLGIDRRVLLNEIEQGRLKATKIGQQWLVEKDVWYDYYNKRTVNRKIS